jgi:tRNA (guanosine-2'-O-)-methyltransferase
MVSGAWVTPGREIKRRRRRRAHSCWDHLIVAPLWPKYGVNLGTLLRTCDAVGACTAVPKLPWVPEALDDEAIRLADLASARERTVVVLGHEDSGIPDDAMELVDVAAEIPMIGTGASLNVAVAGSLVLYRLAGFL